MNINQVITNPPNYEVAFHQVVTPKEAKMLLVTSLFERQRNIKKPNVARIARDINGDDFYPINPITFAINDELKIVIVNGQHTLRAIVETNKPQKLLINFVPNNAKNLYTKFDIHSKRTIRDALKALREWDIRDTDLLYIGAAVVVLMQNKVKDRAINYTAEQIEDAILEWVDYYKDYKEALRGVDGYISKGLGNRMMRQQPLAIWLLVWRYGNAETKDKLIKFVSSATSGINCSYASAQLREEYSSVGRRHNANLESSFVLSAWAAHCTDRKRMGDAWKKNIWNSSPNVYGTNQTLTS